MAITLVQHGVTDNGASSSTTVAVTLGSPVTAGNTLTIQVRRPSGSSINSMAGNGNSYNLSRITQSDAVATIIELCDVLSALSGTTTITATMNAAQVGLGMLVQEWSGGPLTWPNITNSQAGNGTSASPGSVTPLVNGALILGFNALPVANTYTPQTGYTTIDSLATSGGAVEYLVQSSAAGTNALFTLGTTSTYGAVDVVYNPAALALDDVAAYFPRSLPGQPVRLW